MIKKRYIDFGLLYFEKLCILVYEYNENVIYIYEKVMNSIVMNLLKKYY